METIVNFLAGHAQASPNKSAFTFINDGNDKATLSYLELHSAALSISSSLLSLVQPGDRVVLLLPQGLDYIQAFLGCLYAGVVAVPLYPPKNAKHSDRVLSVIESCQASLAITSEDAKVFLVDTLIPLPVYSFQECINESLNRAFNGAINEAANKTANGVTNNNLQKNIPESLAFLQYTSGSTGTPKGVMVSHRNILANLKSLQEATHCSSDDIFCNWLPLFHDLGLVNTILLPIYLGAHSILMSPASFMRRPMNWLEAISFYRATICGAPNFAFDHCVARVKSQQFDNLNLSSWRVAFNAAEPIKPETLSTFSETFASVGFKGSAFYPSYGMAEATVFIAGGTPFGYHTESFQTNKLQRGIATVDKTNEKNTQLVSCGYVQSEHQIKIVNPDSLLVCSGGDIGEIWFSGPSVAEGYWNDPEKTAKTFNAYLEGGQDAYLRTGDLGFIYQGALYIAGRIKDLLIINGRNYYPQDFENLAFDVCDGLRSGGAAAFESEDGAALILEVEPRATKTFAFDQASKVIRAAIFDFFDILLVDIAFVRAGSLPKTSSGKIQRSQTKKYFQESHFEILMSLKTAEVSVSFQAPETKTEQYLVSLWEELLQHPVGRQDNFFRLGGQSLTAAHLVSRINYDYRLALPIHVLFDCDSVHSLAAFIDQEVTRSSHTPIAFISKADELVVSDSQRSLWFIDQFEGGSPQYNICSLFKISGDIDTCALQAAINILIHRHPVLRTCYIQQDGQVCAKVYQEWQFELPVLSLDKTGIAILIDQQIQAPFDLTTDLMIRCHLYMTADHEYQLLLCFHHIAVDGFSLKILEDELGYLYQQKINPSLADLPEPALHFNDYAAFIKYRDLDKQAAVNYWKKQLVGLPSAHNLSMDFSRASKQSFQGSSIYAELNPQLTKKLIEFSKQKKVTLYTLLQTAFACLLHRYSGDQDLVMGSPYANRDLLETKNMLGYFVNPLVLRNSFSDSGSFNEQLHKNNSLIRQAITHNQLSFVELIELLNPERSLSHHPLFQIMFTFNETGTSGFSLGSAAVEQINLCRKFSRFDLTLEITLEQNQLALTWEYATHLFSVETINSLHQSFECLLQSVLANPDIAVNKIPLLSAENENHLISIGLNEGKNSVSHQGIQHLFENQTRRSLNKIAVCFEKQALTYDALNERANQLAHYLIASGVGTGDLVALCIERGLNTVVALLAILKTGAAYVPLDPGYPLDRLNYMLSDAKPLALLCQNNTAQLLSISDNCNIINLDDINCRNLSVENPKLKNFLATDLAYVIYTSGSTGLPKGVKVRHSNVLNFFAGLDDRFIDNHEPRHWLAVTSICFDIFVLELFWTLSRGDQITLQPERPLRAKESLLKSVEFGLFYFASNSELQTDKFELLMEGAKFADRNGLASVWLPERHFHAFGGQFSNPAVAAAAVAAVTKNIRINSGSVVLPLHDPIRVAEEWSMVDNLSAGRISLSVAPGWQPNDFVLAPGVFQNRHAIMKENLTILKRLWKGEHITRVNGLGQECDIAIYPKPIQQEIPISITAAGNLETFEYAGSIGANILTHLLGQTLPELSHKIAVYRAALVKHGFSEADGKVTLMLHTFMHDDQGCVREQAEAPFKQYLTDSISLIQPIADQFNLDLHRDYEQIVDHAFNRYFESSGLFGTPAQCEQKIYQLQKLGVDAIACLIDFGIDNKIVLESLDYIVRLQTLMQKKIAQQELLAERFQNTWQPDQLISQNAITHLQCTPSFARELAPESLNKLSTLLVGGEALPDDLVNYLCAYEHLDVFNMYGPTETTVWVSIKKQLPGKKVVLAGPMINNQFLVLDALQQLTPLGVPGELYVAGKNVSAGYLNNIGLTNEKFIANPYNKNNSAEFSMLYRTGDLVKWVSNGDGGFDLQFLGRGDQQVKINGFRIELGEIESVLNRSPFVSQSIVVSADNKLYAYVIGEEENLLNIKESVASLLPDYMHPAHYIFMSDFPLTPNGKIDKKALPHISISAGPVRQASNDIEAALCRIWAKNLPACEFGVDDDFFGLGGNSLLAIKVISEINSEFGDMDLTVKELFMAPCVFKLSKVIQTKLRVRENLLAYEEKNLEEVVW